MSALKVRVYLWFLFMSWWVPKGSIYVTGLGQAWHTGGKDAKSYRSHHREFLARGFITYL